MPARTHMRFGLLTGGGDCPGLNAVIRAVVKRAVGQLGWEVVGIQDGYRGLVEPGLVQPLALETVRGILPRGGTILGTSNRANPLAYAVKEKGKWITRDMTDVVLARMEKYRLEALVIAGGDGTMTMAHALAARGVKVVGIPKTIDNDLSATDQTFGFDTARVTCTDAVDKLHTTAEAHHRVMIVEVMGRHAGFLALHAAVGGGADAALIPEIPYRIEPVCETIRKRWLRGRSFSVLVVAEGAHPEGGAVSIVERAEAIPGRGVVRLGGAGARLAEAVEKEVDSEVRVTVLGHLQRGGTPSAFDRILGTQFGCRAVDLVEAGTWDHMVALRGDKIIAVPLSEALSRPKRVDPRGELARDARNMGVSLGE